MSHVVFDTGFLYSLVVDTTYSEAVRRVWADRELWVPKSLLGEVTYRQTHPLKGLPPELPQRAKGLIQSRKWGFEVVELTSSELEDAEQLREQIGDPDVAKNRAECEGAVLLARRAPKGSLKLDDKSCLRVVARYVRETTGASLEYSTTTEVLDALVVGGELTTDQRKAIGKNLAAKKRPYI